MKSWKTTVAGLLAAVFTALATGVLETGDWRAVGLTVALAVFGFVAKDRNVTTADPEAIAAAVAEILRRPERDSELPAADMGLSAGAEDDSFRRLAQSMRRRKPGLKVNGVSRVVDNPQAVFLYLDSAPSDDELRDIHERLKA